MRCLPREQNRQPPVERLADGSALESHGRLLSWIESTPSQQDGTETALMRQMRLGNRSGFCHCSELESKGSEEGEGVWERGVPVPGEEARLSPRGKKKKDRLRNYCIRQQDLHSWKNHPANITWKF